MVTAIFSALTLALFAFLGGWQRRWISDDGLIVLRTVRNLLAGNGPVFNAGERVEANTSTLWQYLIYLGGLLSDAPLEIIAMWLALSLTTAALLIAALATAQLWSGGRSRLLILPAGGLVYVALPPARDFATSGLEWGLSLFYLAVLWALLVAWVRAGAQLGRHHTPGVDWSLYLLAFWCGLSWLVRPELALYGGLVGILLLSSARSWRRAAGILAAALPLPLGYQIFRMGYYGLLTPHTAVAKSASDSMWEQGWFYVRDFTGPYTVLLALAVLVVMAAVLLWQRRPQSAPAATDPAAPARAAVLGESRSAGATGRRRLRSPGTITWLILGAAALHFLYVVRVGGDFMHGRMLLLPLFAALLPVMVLPLADFSRSAATGAARWVPAVVSGAGLVVLLGWTAVTVDRGHDVDWREFAGLDLNVVDEREFWTYATQHVAGADAPLTAADYEGMRVLRDLRETAVTAVAQNDAMIMPVVVDEEQELHSWITYPRQEEESDLRDLPPTMYLINLGVTGMYAPLEMRVLDSVGLSTPLGARQPRYPEARIGHDKFLSLEWQIADTDADLVHLPPWYDRREAMLARAALHTPEFVELYESYRSPLTAERFFANLGFALTTGRTLEFSHDPRDYLAEESVAAIERYAADPGDERAAAEARELIQPAEVQISWPSIIQTE